MVRTIVISDIHAHYNEFIRLLEKVQYHPNEDKLFFLGDYVDKGPQAKEVIKEVIKLSKNENVKIIGGNHDDMFLSWIDNQDYRISPYTNEKNAGTSTILSFAPFFKKGENENKTREYILNNYQREIEFLRNLPYYIEDEQHIFVHAGVDLKKSDWKETSLKDFRWIRKSFLEMENFHEKIIVFGHTVTASIRGNQDYSIWFSDKKIGIDGGSKFNGQLNALVIENGKYKEYRVNTPHY